MNDSSKHASSGSSQAHNSNAHGKNATKAKAGAAQDLRALFIDQLQDIYWAEQALVKAIPVLIDNTSSQELVDALSEHLSVTKQQATRLEEVFKSLGEKAQSKKCEAISGIIKESETIIEETQEGQVRDAGIIAAAQKVEHYEIASYGTLASFAKVLGENKAYELLTTTLEEEKTADATLTEIADASVNQDAKAVQSSKNH